MQFHQNPQEDTKAHLYRLEMSDFTKTNQIELILGNQFCININ